MMMMMMMMIWKNGRDSYKKFWSSRFLTVRETRRFFGEKSEKKKPKKVRNSFLVFVGEKRTEKKKGGKRKKNSNPQRTARVLSLVALFVRVFSTKTHTHLSLSYIYTHEYCLLKARVIYTHK